MIENNFEIIRINYKLGGGTMIEVVVPSIEGVEQITISYWHYDVGDEIEEGDDLVELATEKATFNLPSPVTGKLEKIICEEGEVVKSGDIIGIVKEKESTT
jgi:pyruvate dehydrogenase E2 component (dihydrolipoamide acetyltransferase)